MHHYHASISSPGPQRAVSKNVVDRSAQLMTESNLDAHHQGTGEEGRRVIHSFTLVVTVAPGLMGPAGEISNICLMKIEAY